MPKINDDKVQGAHAVISQAISDARGALETNDTEICAAFGLALSQLAGTAAGIDEIAAFAKRHLKH